MNSTSNSDDNSSEETKGNAYYLIEISIGILLVIIVMIVASCYCSRKGFQNRQGRITANTISMNLDSAVTIRVHQVQLQEGFNSYPALLYSQVKQQNLDSATSCCSICLADYSDTDWLRLLPNCGHLFHRDCIDIWLQSNLSCPLCRTSPLPTPLAEVASLTTRLD